MSDPKLKLAMKDVKEILRKYDIAAIVVLSSETKMEYLLNVEPSWSCAFTVTDTEGHYGIRIRAKKAEFPSREAQKKCIQYTAGIFFGFKDVLVTLQGYMDQLKSMLGQHFDISHLTRREDDPPRPRF